MRIKTGDRVAGPLFCLMFPQGGVFDWEGFGGKGRAGEDTGPCG